jgi:hypothetical protein
MIYVPLDKGSGGVRLFCDLVDVDIPAEILLDGTIWIIYFSGNKNGKWSSRAASVSFNVSPTNVSHLPEITIYMDTN